MNASKSSIQVEKSRKAIKKEEAAKKEAKKPILTLRDLVFFNLSLQFDFSKLRLYRNINKFVEHIL